MLGEANFVGSIIASTVAIPEWTMQKKKVSTMMRLSRNNRVRLRRMTCGGAALLYLFVFIGADVLHTENCSFHTGRADCSHGSASEDGCPACAFKAGANSTQPDCTLQIEFVVPLFVRILPCSSTPGHHKFVLCVFLRAPPSYLHILTSPSRKT